MQYCITNFGVVTVGPTTLNPSEETRLYESCRFRALHHLKHWKILSSRYNKLCTIQAFEELQNHTTAGKDYSKSHEYHCRSPRRSGSTWQRTDTSVLATGFVLWFPTVSPLLNTMMHQRCSGGSKSPLLIHH